MHSLKHNLDRCSLETMYISFIRPILKYGSDVWINCSDGLRDSLDDVQLQAARIVTGAIRDMSLESLYNEVGWAGHLWSRAGSHHS